mgnify:CR=1 FL=1
MNNWRERLTQVVARFPGASLRRHPTTAGFRVGSDDGRKEYISDLRIQLRGIDLVCEQTARWLAGDGSR